MERVIVYRSQTEAFVDEAIWSGVGSSIFVPIVCFCVAMFISLLSVEAIVDKLIKYLKYHKCCKVKILKHEFDVYSLKRHTFLISIILTIILTKIFLCLIML